MVLRACLQQMPGQVSVQKGAFATAASRLKEPQLVSWDITIAYCILYIDSI